jgi:hypothetical protein
VVLFESSETFKLFQAFCYTRSEANTAPKMNMFRKILQFVQKASTGKLKSCSEISAAVVHWWGSRPATIKYTGKQS